MYSFAPKYRRNPNEKVHSLYYGVASGGRVMTSLVKPSLDRNRLEATRTYEPGLAPGEGGQIARLILGGMETTLDEIEYILEAKKQKKWKPRRSNREVADMCYALLEWRNERIRYLRKNPSERRKPKKTARLYLPTGYRMVDTSVPGLRVLAEG